MTSDTPSLIARFIRRDIQSMHGYAVQPSAGLVKLDTMENPHRLPAALREALGQRLAEVALNRYPAERGNVLRAALARHAGMPEGCDILLGNGSDEIISLLSMACAIPGAVALAPLPGFVMYEMSAKLLGLRFVGVPLTADFELDAPAMLAAIREHQPALVYLAYPNNPTANLWDDTVIDQIIEAAPGLVVMDEAYQPFAARDSMARLKRHPQVLLMRTMSKFGLAGVRIGYLIGRQRIDCRSRQAAPAVQHQRAQLRGRAVCAGACRRIRPPGGVTAQRARAPASSDQGDARRAALPERSQHDPGARARFEGLLRRHEGTRRACEKHRRFAPAAGQLRAPDGRHAGRKHLDDRRLESEPVMSTATTTERKAEVSRNTAETQIRVAINLDGTGAAQLATGIGFFDHMLDQIARHGLIDLLIDCKGDLHIDGHHTVEDVGITFGQAMAKAVGDKKGLRRYGHAYVPLDEALSRVVIDFSGRPGLHMRVDFKSGMIGELDTQLVYEFFQGFSNHAGVTLHIDNLHGDNAHHQCETIFKAFARALRMALEIDPRAAGVIPSTKGSL